MNFEFNVKTTQDRVFKPTKIIIYIGSKETVNNVEYIKVGTDLIETTAKGYIKEYSENLMPVSILSAIDGFDTSTMKPTINETAVNQILAGFGLELD